MFLKIYRVPSSCKCCGQLSDQSDFPLGSQCLRGFDVDMRHNTCLPSQAHFQDVHHIHLGHGHPYPASDLAHFLKLEIVLDLMAHGTPLVGAVGKAFT